MKIEAWRAREIERKRIVDGLKQRFSRLLEEINPSPESIEETDAPFLDAASFFFMELENRRGNFAGEERHRLVDFTDEAMAEIDKMARSPEEACMLIATLGLELQQTGLSSFRSRLESQQGGNPALIYGAPSAMHKIEISDQ